MSNWSLRHWDFIGHSDLGIGHSRSYTSGMIPAGESVEPEEFFPPRYWWTVRIVPLCLVILLGLVGLRIWWGHDVAARFEARVKEIRLASAAIRQNAPPDAENAAI